jgi:hypothetical protein
MDISMLSSRTFLENESIAKSGKSHRRKGLNFRVFALKLSKILSGKQ